MLQSLASSRERQARLIADAGHELRTPLTSLRTNIELLAADAASGMLRQQDRIDILADVKAQLVEFTALIGDLVELARDETAASPEPLDFRNVVNSALDRVRLRRTGCSSTSSSIRSTSSATPTCWSAPSPICWTMR